MGTSVRPFQIAFRVLLAAFFLSLLVIVSNPGGARQAILAKSRSREPAPRSDQTVAGDAHRKTSVATSAIASTSSQPAAQPEPTLAEAPPIATSATRAGSEATEAPTRTARQTTGEARRIFSAREAGSRLAITNRRGSSLAMPVLSPAALRSEDRPKEFVELPPPPERGSDDLVAAKPQPFPPDDADALTETQRSAEVHDHLRRHAITDRPVKSQETDPEHLRSRMEAEIDSLRREIDRLSESGRIAAQLERLERGHAELLRLHQELPVDQLMQLLHLLLGELESVREATARTGDASFSGAASVEGQPAAGRGRVSLQITEASIEDVLRMLSQLSGATIVVDEKSPESRALPPEPRHDPPGNEVFGDEPAADGTPDRGSSGEGSTSAMQPVVRFPEAPVALNQPTDSPGRSADGAGRIQQVAGTMSCVQCHPNHVPR